MYKNNKITVIVPAYNEEAHIEEVVAGIPDFVDLVVIINDCSTDNTASIVLSLQDKRLKVLTHKKNTGVGGAIISGHEESLKHKSDINVVMAGDNQMDPSYLTILLDEIIDNKYDYVKGNRFYSTKTIRNMPKIRIFGNVFLSFLNKLASGYWNVFDPQNGYTAIKTDVLSRIDLENISMGYFFENSILVELNIISAKVTDVPIPAKYENEKSSLKISKIIFPFLYLMFKYFNRRIFYKYFLRGVHPISIFMFFGSCMFAWGLVFGLIKWQESAAMGAPTGTGTVMLAVLPLLMGFELLLWAIVLDIQEGGK